MPVVRCVPVGRRVASGREGRLESALRYLGRVLSHHLLGLVVSSARESGWVVRGMTGASLGIGARGASKGITTGACITRTLVGERRRRRLRENDGRIRSGSSEILLNAMLKIAQRGGIDVELPLEVRAHL
jgi:hypothetical protein